MAKKDDIDLAAVRIELEALREQVIAATEHGAEATRPVELDQGPGLDVCRVWTRYRARR